LQSECQLFLLSRADLGIDTVGFCVQESYWARGSWGDADPGVMPILALRTMAAYVDCGRLFVVLWQMVCGKERLSDTPGAGDTHAPLPDPVAQNTPGRSRRTLPWYAVPGS